MSKYYPPTDGESKFNCIHCGVFAKQKWGQLYYGSHSTTSSPITYCRCEHCEYFSYWHQGCMIIPAEAPVCPPHPDMPASVIDEYNEARSIFARSPRAAVALLRLAIQKLMPELGEKGDNINGDIKSLVAKGLPVQVQQAFDFCRVVGNNAVHPGEINLNDTPEMGQHLFSMINFIVEDQITRPKQIAELYAQLPESARAAVEKRDA
ncbi:MAG: DUF4145 domain-containing protein [Burkholderiales bacterium]|uniref:DUF4145 domain-containing protein n=1 Tax=Limnobacter sp. TaxID=2003368 RepID=UPI00393FC22F|nr:DUF4145 domain-containing protein [Burkholderiales bacterium]